MKAISLHQPWASFIAAGIKKQETRAYAPPVSYIGKRIAIHAAKRPVDEAGYQWAERNHIPRRNIPFGVVVCTVLFGGAYQVGEGKEGRQLLPIIAKLPGPLNIDMICPDEFGDYSPGRWIWYFSNQKIFDPPIPEIGRQKFWEWNPQTIGKVV